MVPWRRRVVPKRWGRRLQSREQRPRGELQWLRLQQRIRYEQWLRLEREQRRVRFEQRSALRQLCYWRARAIDRHVSGRASRWLRQRAGSVPVLRFRRGALLRGVPGHFLAVPVLPGRRLLSGRSLQRDDVSEDRELVPQRISHRVRERLLSSRLFDVLPRRGVVRHRQPVVPRDGHREQRHR